VGGPPKPQALPPRRLYVPLERRQRRKRRKPFLRLPRLKPGCLLPLLAGLALALPVLLYLLAPGRTNVLLLGIDYVDPGSAVARSDTIILATLDPLKPDVGLLSVPRDLWVSIPGVGENRINTAHFFAENRQPGSGPAALRQTIAQNFGVDLPYYARIRFEGFREVVDALGGVTIELPEAMAGYPAGKHHLTGNKALAFVRHRADSDDFFRMSHGQLMLKALLKNMSNPLKWPRLPGVARAFFASIDTNLPVWLWPRLGLALLRAGPDGVESYQVTREMVTPFTTDQGASVLLPNWAMIHLLVEQVFGQ
jgi:LCP family protein required for cell wall assembly